MKVAVLLLCVFVCSLAIKANPWEAPSEFYDFIAKYNKSYTAEEFSKRLVIFKQNLKELNRLNRESATSRLGTKFGINKFADISKEEFKSHLGYKPISTSTNKQVDPVHAQAIPTSYDWRKSGAVTPVKDQGQCGSCWAFSATEGIESAYYLAKKKLFVLSPQQIVSCDDNDDGCNGGDLPTAFQYVQGAGMETNAIYPYTSGDGDDGTCQYNQQDVVVTISGFKYATTSGNETQMQLASLQHGPLSICVDASTWQYYESGVIKSGCGDTLDHCVQIVGWSSTAQNIPYWIIRNSWNTDWGLNGYLWVERNKDECGVSDEATYVVI